MTTGVEERFAGRYELGDVLGAGGTGTVRCAHDTVLDRPVAIKLLRAGGADEVDRARMRIEAQLAGSLVHPGIAQVYDYGEDRENGANGAGSDALTPYIVMEYVEGTSLWHTLRERRTLPPEQVMDVVGQVAAALRVAHAAGIVHRDLKPGNILLTGEAAAGHQRAVLVDFGIARAADLDPLTQTGTIVGTVDYISPEQTQGRSAGTHSDVYSLGMVAYEALSGLKPFRRENQVATALAHLHDEAPPLPDDVPPPVAALVTRMIAKDPEQRPTADEVARVATALADPTAEVRAPVLPPPPSPRRVAAAKVPLWRRETLRSRRLQVAGAAVVVAVAVGSMVAARPSPPVVPDLEGMTASEAQAAVEDLGLTVEREPVDGRSERGTVLDQQPSAGSRAEDGSVLLSVASGRAVVDPAGLVGLEYDEAARRLVSLGMVPVRREAERPGADGTVVTALPQGRLKVGSMVTLTVGVPPSQPTSGLSPQ